MDSQKRLVQSKSNRKIIDIISINDPKRQFWIRELDWDLANVQAKTLK
jgi:hypothetical protein